MQLVGRSAGNMEEEEEEEEEGRALTLPCAPARGVKERRRMASGSGSHRGPLAHLSRSVSGFKARPGLSCLGVAKALLG